jgi:effector-binding domain-containing protein
MDYKIEIEERQPQHTLSVREQVIRAEIDRVLTEMLPRLNAYLKQQNVEPDGPPFVRYHSSREVERIEVDVEFGVPISRELDAGDGNMVPGRLPGGEALVIRYQGPYGESHEAYDRLEAWIEEQHGYEAGGAPWEFHILAAEAADEDSLQLEIMYPLQKVER